MGDMVHCTIHNPIGNGAQSTAGVGLIPAGHTVPAKLPLTTFNSLRDHSPFECKLAGGPESAKAAAASATAEFEEPRTARLKKEAKRAERLQAKKKAAAEKAKEEAESKAEEAAEKFKKEEAGAVAAAEKAAKRPSPPTGAPPPEEGK